MTNLATFECCNDEERYSRDNTSQLHPIHGPIPLMPVSIFILGLQSMEISGSIPSQNWCTMKSLNYLHLKDLPYLNGTLPACLGNISGLGSITIEHTGIQGEIPWSRWMPLFEDRGNVVNSRGLRFSLLGNLGLYGRALPEEFPL